MTLTFAPPTNAELLARFEHEHFERHSISPGRRQRSLVTLNTFAALLDGRTLVEAIPSDLMRWQGAELTRGMKPNTVRNRETMIRAFIGWARLAELISFENYSSLKCVTPVRGARSGIQPKPYKKAEIERLRELLAARFPLAPETGKGSRMIRRFLRGESRLRGAVYKHARRLQYEAQISIALEEGLRVEELHALTIPQLHPDNTGVVVFTAKGEPGEVREREVPYTAHSRQCVYEWLEFRALLAPDHESPWLTLTSAAPREAQKKRCLEESLHTFGRPYYRWHRFRHTFGTERLRAGMALEKLRVAMGHANIEHTLAYAQIVDADVLVEAERTEGDFVRSLGLAA